MVWYGMGWYGMVCMDGDGGDDGRGMGTVSLNTEDVKGQALLQYIFPHV